MSDEPKIATPCPTCGNSTLFVGSGGHLTCSWLKCRQPGVEVAIDALKQQRQALDDLVLWTLGEIGDFPGLPDDWPKRKYYWRSVLRAKHAELLSAREAPHGR
jgi:hypothetical protein